MDKYEVLFIFYVISSAALFFAGFSIGEGKVSLHTEKHHCEYVEKTECKQVWVKK